MSQNNYEYNIFVKIKINFSHLLKMITYITNYYI